MTILLTDISKRFDGHLVLDNVSLEVPRGSLLSLIHI